MHSNTSMRRRQETLRHCPPVGLGALRPSHFARWRSLAGWREAYPEQMAKVVQERVIHGRNMVPALGPHHEDACIHQDLEVMRNRRLGNVEAVRYLSARQLPNRSDLLDHPKTSRVRERLQCADDLAITQARSHSQTSMHGRRTGQVFTQPWRLPLPAESGKARAMPR